MRSRAKGAKMLQQQMVMDPPRLLPARALATDRDSVASNIAPIAPTATRMASLRRSAWAGVDVDGRRRRAPEDGEELQACELSKMRRQDDRPMRGKTSSQDRSINGMWTSRGGMEEMERRRSRC